MELLLAEALARRGFSDARVLAALMRVDRAAFVPGALAAHAHDDTALPIGAGQTISQPFVVALMTSALRVGPGDKVLEVGTGSGYQAAVLAELGCDVYTVERVPELAERAALTLATAGIRLHLRVGDGTAGWPEEAPFEGIIVTAGAERVPRALLEQVLVGGRIVIPLGSPERQQLHVVTRHDTGFRSEPILDVHFVPLVVTAVERRS